MITRRMAELERQANELIERNKDMPRMMRELMEKQRREISLGICTDELRREGRALAAKADAFEASMDSLRKDWMSEVNRARKEQRRATKKEAERAS